MKKHLSMILAFSLLVLGFGAIKVLGQASSGGGTQFVLYNAGVQSTAAFKMAIFEVSCTPSAATTCAAAAATVGPTFLAQPDCAMSGFSGANTVGVSHSWNGTFTQDTVTIIFAASGSSLGKVSLVCWGL